MASFTPDKANLQNLCTDLVQLQQQSGIISDQIRQALPEVSNIIYGSPAKNNDRDISLLHSSIESLTILEKIKDYGDTLNKIISYAIR